MKPRGAPPINPWRPEEDTFLIAQRGVMPKMDIAKHLDRKDSEVSRRITHLIKEGRMPKGRMVIPGAFAAKKRGTPLDREIVVSEVEYLLALGYRTPDRLRILTGLRVAVEGLSLDDWKRYADRTLADVCAEMFYYGTP